MGSNNKRVLDEGLKKMRKMIENHLKIVGQDLAMHALMSAVDAYDADSNAENLTGNTRFGFASAAFYDGKLICGPYSVKDFEDGGPTAGMVDVGSSGFHDYDSGTWIGSEVDPSVKDYANPDLEFQPTKKGMYGYMMTISWIQSVYKPAKKGMCVVVANRSPYVNYLHDFREFDILETESDMESIKKKIMDAFGRHPIA